MNFKKYTIGLAICGYTLIGQADTMDEAIAICEADGQCIAYQIHDQVGLAAHYSAATHQLWVY
jgi:hypothetical protein